MQSENMTVQEALREFARYGITISSNTFRRKAGEGKLPEGMKRGVLYHRDLVQTLIAQERKKLAETRSKLERDEEPVIVKFQRVTPSNIHALADAIEAIFETRPDVERWQTWIERNPDIAYMLRVDGRTVGCGLIVPLTEQKIQHILSEQVTPPTYPGEIAQYTPGMTTNIYVRSVGIIPTATHAQKRRWAGILVRDFLKVIIDLGMRGVIIDKIYSRSETVDGRRILRHIGFTEIPSITHHSNFIIDVKTSGLKVIKLYRDALNVWQREHGGEGE